MPAVTSRQKCTILSFVRENVNVEEWMTASYILVSKRWPTPLATAEAGAGCPSSEQVGPRRAAQHITSFK